MFDFSIQEFLVFEYKMNMAGAWLIGGMVLMFSCWVLGLSLKRRGLWLRRIVATLAMLCFFGAISAAVALEAIMKSIVGFPHYPELKAHAQRYGEGGIAVLRQKLQRNGQLMYRDVACLDNDVKQWQSREQALRLLEGKPATRSTGKTATGEALAMFDATKTGGNQ